MNDESRPKAAHETPAKASTAIIPRPDLWAAYPDPAVNFRVTMYGLPIEQYRAEWQRCRDEGWARWELERRLPVPEGVSA